MPSVRPQIDLLERQCADVIALARKGDAAALQSLFKERAESCGIRETHFGAVRVEADTAAKVLVAAADDPENIDLAKYTPFECYHHLGRDTNLLIVKVLLAFKINVNQIDPKGFPPLIRHLIDGGRFHPHEHTSHTKLLLDAKADPNQKDRFGRNSLHAVYSGEVNVYALEERGLQPFKERCSLLLDAKAHVNARDRSGKTPLQTLDLRYYSRTFPELRSMLIQAGADQTKWVKAPVSNLPAPPTYKKLEDDLLKLFENRDYNGVKNIFEMDPNIPLEIAERCEKVANRAIHTEMDPLFDYPHLSREEEDYMTHSIRPVKAYLEAYATRRHFESEKQKEDICKEIQSAIPQMADVVAQLISEYSI